MLERVRTTVHDTIHSESMRENIRFLLRVLLKLLQIWLCGMVLLLSATVVYLILYAIIMPVRVIEQPLHFNYGPHSQVNPSYIQDTVSLPTARVNFLTNRIQWQSTNFTAKDEVVERILLADLSYDIIVQIELADCVKNSDIGMFMINSTLKSSRGQILGTSARSSVLKHTNWLVRFLDTCFWAIPIEMGFTNAAQSITALSFNAFTESREHPLGSAEITLNHPELQIYSAKIIIIVQLNGLRYLMYHWFLPTAILAIFNIAFFEGFVLLIWYTTKVLGEDEEEEEGLVKEPQPRSTFRLKSN